VLNILKEQSSSPKLTKEQILFALDKFRKLDLTIEANKERLIDSLVKCVLLYDDKLVITFNFKNEPVTVPTSEEFDAIEKSSDIEAFASPKKESRTKVLLFLFCDSVGIDPLKTLCVLNMGSKHSLVVSCGDLARRG
jgi:hypothetical protein